jgi:hypothetical protein
MIVMLPAAFTAVLTVNEAVMLLDEEAVTMLAQPAPAVPVNDDPDTPTRVDVLPPISPAVMVLAP